ncbi:MAG: TIGR03013 family PEP-CTERM/XrtA system glycosyltransferase [Alphaproteobacteria bacterium]|nr:TIGR03013 family PEP-CTERM/XrtA system glycosyltransferase [Alphaproteobacteria bacterium]
MSDALMNHAPNSAVAPAPKAIHSLLPVASGAISQKRRRFMPPSRVVLTALDVTLMAGAVAALIMSVWQRLGFDTPEDAAAATLCLSWALLAFAYASGCYRYDALVSFSVSVTRLVVGLGVSALLLVPLMHLGLGLLSPAPAFRSFSRCLTIVLLGLGAGLSGGIVARIAFLAMARRHWFRRSILVIGTGVRARYLRDLFRATDRHHTAELHFVTEEYLGGWPPSNAAGEPIEAIPGVPTVEELESRLAIDQVVVAVDERRRLFFDHLLPWKANGIPVFDFNSFVEQETGRVDLKWTETDWLLYSDGFRFGTLDRALKRLVDIGVSATFLVLAMPCLLLVAALIVLEDRGPVFYRQERVSQGGRIFRIVKFRTMRTDAEKFGAQWATQDDPRITGIGKVLRRTRIDEVPQLFNVLRGDMSMVGPRPERPVFVKELSAKIRLYHLRHSVKAGITGWAQINYPYGASVEDAERKLEFDLFYLKHFSVLRDLAIMLQTFRVLVFAQGGR